MIESAAFLRMGFVCSNTGHFCTYCIVPSFIEYVHDNEIVQYFFHLLCLDGLVGWIFVLDVVPLR